MHFFHIATSKSRPRPACFATFYLEICFAPQRHALFPGRRPCQPTGLRVSQPESANMKARVSQQEGASQPTRKARVSQPGRESANPVAGQTTRSHAGHERKGNETRGSRERKGDERNLISLFFPRRIPNVTRYSLTKLLT